MPTRANRTLSARRDRRGGVTLNADKEVIVSDMRPNAVLTFCYFPEIF